MAFANLFTGLSAVEERVTSPGQPAFTHWNETGQRGNARKRKIQVERTGPYKKKPCYAAHTTRSHNATSFREDDSKAIHYHMHNTNSKHASVGFTKEVIHNHSYKAGHNNKGQNYTTKNNPNVNKQQQKKKPEGQKNHHHQQKDRRMPANKGGSHQTHQPTWGKSGKYRQNINDKQGVQVNRTRSMSQEFMDQNAMLVDGRLICRHFLWGRCIKDDDCQLEHVKGHNNVVKEVCKFYVQGLCTKGESCPFMHKSFPCKFFHRRGKCSQGADCRFSHEPLNDITNQLLHEIFKRDEDLKALSKKAEQEPSGQPENTDESEITEASRPSDTLLQPLRPNFYNSGETNAEKESLLRQTEELADVMEEAVPPDAAQSYIPPSSNLKHEEPVCYSVAAVLGPQLFKPFPSFFITPESQESYSSVSANQSEVPYSVDAVLRSCKSVENSTFGHTPTPLTAQTVSYTPNTVPMLSSKTQDEKVLHSVNTRNEVNNSQEKVFKSLSSLQVHTSLLSKNCPSLTLASRHNETQGGNMPPSMRPAQRATNEVKLELLHSPLTVAKKSVLSKGEVKGRMHVPLDITCSDTCKSEGVLPFVRTNRKSIFSKPSSWTSPSKHPTQSRPHLSVLTSDSEASIKPFSPSGFTEFKGGAAVAVVPVTSSTKTSDSANSGSRHFVEKQPTEIHLHSKKRQSVLNHDTQPYSNGITAECSSKTAHDLAVGCKKTLKRPFQNLFASPITDTLQPIDNSVPSSSCPQGFIQSSCLAPQPAGCRSNRGESVVEPDKATARSFLSLFAAPLSAAPLQSIQSQPDYSRTSSCSHQSNQSVENTSHLSNSKPSTSDLGTPPQHQVNTVKEIYRATRSTYCSPNPKIENEDSSTEHIKKPPKQLLNPVCSLDSLGEMSTSPTPCGNSPSTTHAHQQLPDIAADKVADTANSVLKTLFLCLSPYQQDEEQQDSIQISVTSDSRLQVQQSTERTVARSAEHQPSLQTPQIPLEATGASTLSSPGTTELQGRNSGTHTMPCKPVAPLMQRHTRPRQRHALKEAPWVNGDVVVKPLKDLFKTLETSVFHFGH